MVKKLAIAMAFLLLATTGMSMLSWGASPRVQTPVELTTYTNGNADASLLFEQPGNNTELALKVPKRITVLGASVNVSARNYIWNDTFTDTVAANFSLFNPIYRLDATSDPDNVTIAKAYDDQFGDKSLDPRWKWLNQAPSFDEGNISAGALQVSAGIGTNLWNTTVTGNFLYQNISTYNYTAQLKVGSNPNVPGQRAGLLAYNNNSAWAALLYGNDSTGMKLTRISTYGGVSVQANISLQTNPLYLRIYRNYVSGTYFRFSYSTDGLNFTTVDSMNLTWTNIYTPYSWIGPVVTDGLAGQSFTADFDDFWVNLWYPGGYMTSPKRPEAGEIQSCLLSWDVVLPYFSNLTIGAMGSQYATGWDSLKNNIQNDFLLKGNLFQYNVSFVASFGNINTSVLKEVRVNITVKDQPKNVSIDFGDHGSWDWSQSGTMGAAPVKLDFAAWFSREVAGATEDGEGLVTIPLTVHSDGKGWINLTGLSVRYVVNSEPSEPVLEGPVNGSWVTTLTPSLTFSAADIDGGTLRYIIEVYFRNGPLLVRIDQTQGPSGWSATSYAVGAMANYTFPFDKALGQGEHYVWRARAYDGYVAGQWSQKREFAIDTTTPEGWVIDDGSETTSGTSLHCNLALTDPESQISAYEVWLGTSPGGSDLMPKTRLTDPNVTVENLTLIYGYKYFFTARAENGAGLWSAPVSSDGIGVKKGAVNRVPSVNITSPAEGAALTGVVKLSGKASDIDFLDTLAVLVQVDSGEWMEAEGNNSWSFSWDSNKVQNGAHRISVKAWDGRANSPISTVNVSVSNIHDIQIISSEPSADPKLSENSSMLFSVEARDPLNRQLVYQWLVDEVPLPGETKRLFTFRAGYGDAGAHLIRVSVYSTPDQVNFTWNLSVTNVNRPPSANIASPVAGEKIVSGKAASFDATGSSDPDTEDNLTYSWNFGDGTTGTGLKVEHTYKKGGKYSVTLTVNDPYTYATVPVEVDVKAVSVVSTDLWSQYGNMILAVLAILVVIVVLGAVGMAASRRRRPEDRAAAGAAERRTTAPQRTNIESTISEEEERAFRQGKPSGRPAEPAYEVAPQPAAPAYEGSSAAPLYEAQAAQVYEGQAAPAYEAATAESYEQPAYEMQAETGRPSWATPVGRAPAQAYEPAAPAYEETAQAYEEPAAGMTTLTPPPEAADEMTRLLSVLEGRTAPAPPPPARAPPAPARAAPPRAPQPARAPPARAPTTPAYAPAPARPPAQAYAPRPGYAPAPARAPAPTHARGQAYAPQPARSPEPMYAPAQAEPSMDDIFASLQSIGEEFDTSAPAAPPAPAPRPRAPAPAAQYAAAAAPAAAAAAPAPAPPRPAYAPTTIPVKAAGKKKLMRCPKCQVIFEVQDTGVRPLPIKCTACGATGAIKK